MRSVYEVRRGNRCASNSCPNSKPEDGGKFCHACRKDVIENPPAHIGNSGSANTCIVCFTDLTADEDIKVLPCGHRFHPQCVKEWVAHDPFNGNRCPYLAACPCHR